MNLTRDGRVYMLIRQNDSKTAIRLLNVKQIFLWRRSMLSV